MIAVNTTFRLARWADALYAMDRQWWVLHTPEIKAAFQGLLFCGAPCKDFDLRVQALRRPEFDHFNNSGAGAVALAMLRGAKTVYLLGYDCQRTGGKSHWHGDHPKPLTNVASIGRWLKFFERLAAHAKTKGVRIINCTRETALKFERQALEAVVPARQEAA